MKITNVDGYCLSSPYGDGKAFGQPLGVKSIGIVEIRTSDGLVGIGETYSGVYVPELIKPTVKFIESLIVGMNPLNIEDVYNSMDIPFVGMGAWAMDMPFMKRVSKAKIAKSPKLKGMDVERTKRACRHFRLNPTTIINFVEGSRFTHEKHQKQRSPFKHLLKPKAGGIAFTLEVLGEKMDGLLNTSIVYQGTSETICKDMLFGKLKKVHVHISVQPVADQLIGNYQHDREFRVDFQQHLNQIWQDKDAQIDVMEECNSLSEIKAAHSN